MASAAEFLLQSQNADGGWGYRARGMTYVEPTAAAMLALRDDHARQRARDFLLAHQRADGGWGIAAMDAESGWMTAWAVRALADAERPDTRAAVERGAAFLLALETLRIEDEPTRSKIRAMFKMDSALRGFPWQPGDAAWVHPTSLAILALCAAGKRDHARVHEGVDYLFDRAVATGGWNIGNPEMLDKPMPATIQDTAVALLALRAVNVSRDAWQVTKAVAYLRGAVSRAQTPAELAWGIYALRACGDDVGDAVARLNARQNADGSWQGNPFITAIALTSQK
jgi:hypothetical protein